VCVGISRDTVQSHREFAAANDLTTPLLSDPSGAICTTLGVLPDPDGNPKRTTFVIDKQGIIRYIFEAVKVPGHADEVFEKVREMNS
jgi:thioredoxin-dependent peroxiredoxin